MKFLLLGYYRIHTLGYPVITRECKCYFPKATRTSLVTVHSGKHFAGSVIPMATQLQGPPSDPCVLYKHFWQEPQRLMHKDDLILQACHYQPSDTQLGPSFSPCDYFPSPWKKRARQSGSLALLFPIGPTRSLGVQTTPCLEVPGPLSVTTPSHFHSSSVDFAKPLASLLAACGREASRGAGLTEGLASHEGVEKDNKILSQPQTLQSGKESHPHGHVLFHQLVLNHLTQAQLSIATVIGF